MTDLPTDSSDANPTTAYEPPATNPPPTAPTLGPTTGTSPVPSPTPPPAWERTGGDSGRTGTIVFGAILVAIGLWFFADQTLGLEMPNLRWSELWPLIIIGIGGWIVLSSLRRSR